MGRRTLTAHSLEFHQKRQVERTYAPANLDGLDLLEEFEKWLENLQLNDLHDPANNLWVRVAGYESNLMRRFMLVSVEVGSYGEAGAVVDSRSGSVLMPLTAEQAPTGITRAVLHVPEHGEVAFFFSEYSGRGSGGSRLLRAFATHWSRAYGFTMVQQAVTEGEAWADAAELREVEVRVRRHSPDIADPAEETLAVYSHVLRPPRGKFLRRDLLGELKERHGRAAAAVGLDSMPANSEVLVTLRNREGRQKKFVLGEGGDLPALREELNGPGEPVLTNMGLVEVCADKASDLLDRL